MGKDWGGSGQRMGGSGQRLHFVGKKLIFVGKKKMHHVWEYMVAGQANSSLNMILQRQKMIFPQISTHMKGVFHYPNFEEI